MRTPSPLCLLALSLTFATCAPPAAHAQWISGGGEILSDIEPGPAYVEDATHGFMAFGIWDSFFYGLEITSTRIGTNGTSPWYTTGSGNIITAVGNGTKSALSAAPDGLGGAVIAWVDERSVARGVYAQRVLDTGAPEWVSSGDPVAVSATSGIETAVCGDGAGGAYVAWLEDWGTQRVPYLMHLADDGSPRWGFAIPLTVDINTNAAELRAVPDGSGGVIVTWREYAYDAEGDLYAQRLAGNGSALWNAYGEPIKYGAGFQRNARVIPDLAGGFYAVWEDEVYNDGTPYIATNRIGAAGTELWLTFGSGYILSSGFGINPTVVRDPVTGHPIYAWQGTDGFNPILVVRRLTGAGMNLLTGASYWPEMPFGVLYGTQHSIVPDGQGGAWFVFHEQYAAGIRATRLNQAGQFVTPYYGIRFGDGPIGSSFAMSDGAGGVIGAWRSPGTGPYGDPMRSQRLTSTESIGSHFPDIESVTDVPNDEGGMVRLAVGSAWADFLPYSETKPVLYYGVWRRAEQASSPAAAERGAPFAAAVEAGTDLVERMRQGPVFLTRELALAANFPTGAWESVGLHGALGVTNYTFLAPTRRDSSGASGSHEVFVVSCHTATTLRGFSTPDSGWSVDNLPPAPPSALVGQQGGGTVAMSWAASPAQDLGYYAIYRSQSAGFTPAPGYRIGTTTDLTFEDPNWKPSSNYKLTAVDRHGNESSWLAMGPGQIVGVPGGGEARNFLAHARPNPMRDACTLDFGLAREGAVSLSVFDVTGREVRRLARGTWPAGSHQLDWDGRDDDGRQLQSGIYWVRLTAPGYEARERIAKVR